MTEQEVDPQSVFQDRELTFLEEDLIWKERVDTTQKEAWRMARNLDPEALHRGRVIVARTQEEGRGRQGREWFSPEEGLWLTLLLKPRIPNHHMFPHMTVIGALAVCRTIESQSDAKPLIRWPNDVVFPHQKGLRKIAGILVETRETGKNRTTLCAVGVGLNVNIPEDAFPDDLRGDATSLLVETDREYGKSQLLGPFLSAFDDYIGKLYRDRHDEIDREWTERSAILNRRVRVRFEGEVLNGTVEDVSLENGLTLRMDTGGYRILEQAHVESLRLAESSSD